MNITLSVQNKLCIVVVLLSQLMIGCNGYFDNTNNFICSKVVDTGKISKVIAEFDEAVNSSHILSIDKCTRRWDNIEKRVERVPWKEVVLFIELQNNLKEAKQAIGYYFIEDDKGYFGVRCNGVVNPNNARDYIDGQDSIILSVRLLSDSNNKLRYCNNIVDSMGDKQLNLNFFK